MRFKKKHEDVVLQEDFGQLFKEFSQNEKKEGQMVNGLVIGIEKEFVIVDVGMKSEGRIPISEFLNDKDNTSHIDKNRKIDSVKVGDRFDVFVERFEGRNGYIILSRERAIKDEAWRKFESLYAQDAQIEGKVIGNVKGGFAVELDGIIAFLPRSQVDIKPIRDVANLIGSREQFKILKMDNAQGNIVISRRAILEESRKEARNELLSHIEEGTILEGTVKNITDYGAFIDLKSTDGLLHITDISWSKVSHPSEVLSVGQVLKVMVIKYNTDSQRISLGLKQLTKNPWEEFEEKYKAGTRVCGKVTMIKDYGAFVELEPNVEGLVYHTEIDWLAKNIHPRKQLDINDEVEVVVLDIDITRHRISLSIKQCKPNPWESFIAVHPVGTRLKCAIRNITDFGIFIVPEESVDLELAIIMLIPAGELSWDEPPEVVMSRHTKGQIIDCVIISTDVERERIGASIRQLTVDPLEKAAQEFTENVSMSVKVKSIYKHGIDVELKNNVIAYMPIAELSSNKEDQRTDSCKEGDIMEVKMIGVDFAKRRIEVSKRALEIEEEAQLKARYGENAKFSATSIGDLFEAIDDK